MAIKVEIFYEAKCKHCSHCETIRRKTKCKLTGFTITQKDKACDKLKL